MPTVAEANKNRQELKYFVQEHCLLRGFQLWDSSLDDYCYRCYSYKEEVYDVLHDLGFVEVRSTSIDKRFYRNRKGHIYCQKFKNSDHYYFGFIEGLEFEYLDLSFNNLNAIIETTGIDNIAQATLSGMSVQEPMRLLKNLDANYKKISYFVWFHEVFKVYITFDGYTVQIAGSPRK